MAHSPTSDRQDLAALGYKEELKRTLGSFSAFAAGFSYLSILTGMFQMFHEGFGRGGPAFFWTWPIVFIGQFLVALCFAELAAHYPLSGGVYQWSKRVGSAAIGWMAGWVYLASLIITISAVALALQVTLPQIASDFHLIGVPGDRSSATQNAVLLGCILIGITTLINTVGVRLLARINNVGVFAELLGVGALIVLLACHVRTGPAIVLETHGKGAGLAFGYLGPFLAAALTASYVMYGFDTAGTVAEETSEPRRRAPWAILEALVATAVAGALLMLTAMMAVTDFDELAKDGLPFVVKQVLPSGVAEMFLWDVVVAITVCCLAVHAGTVRLMFSMSRDNNLPFSRPLARVAVRARVPVVPAIVAGFLAAAILLVDLISPGFVDLVAPIAILWANLAYLFVTAPLLYRRLKDWPPQRNAESKTLFSLGRWGLPVNLLAVLWSIAMIVNIGWPRAHGESEPWHHQHGAFLVTALLVLIGAAYYGLVQRHKTGILDEHRPDSACSPAELGGK
jgi:urea carboxylase system permease